MNKFLLKLNKEGIEINKILFTSLQNDEVFGENQELYIKQNDDGSYSFCCYRYGIGNGCVPVEEEYYTGTYEEMYKELIKELINVSVHINTMDTSDVLILLSNGENIFFNDKGFYQNGEYINF